MVFSAFCFLHFWVSEDLEDPLDDPCEYLDAGLLLAFAESQSASRISPVSSGCLSITFQLVLCTEFWTEILYPLQQLYSVFGLPVLTPESHHDWFWEVLHIHCFQHGPFLQPMTISGSLVSLVPGPFGRVSFICGGTILCPISFAGPSWSFHLFGCDLVPWLLFVPITNLASPSFLEFPLLVLPDYLVLSTRSLPTLEAMSLRSSSSTGLLVMLAPCNGMSEPLKSYPRYFFRNVSVIYRVPALIQFLTLQGLWVLPVPCGGMPKLPVYPTLVSMYLAICKFLPVFFNLTSFFFTFSLHFSPRSNRVLNLSTHTAHMRIRYKYDRVLPGTLRETLTIL